ncbi:hypothetical protein GF340_06120 [Candidatus Peregrinibacteria bacterium]|nr:hypothetical protein [Candidatus Peregrinibacteria bacterium]
MESKTATLKWPYKISALKNNRTIVLALIIVDLAMAIASNIVDYPWLMSTEWYLRPFAPICSMFPLTLFIWFSLYYFRKKIPAWFTFFVFTGIISYGLMAVLYFPAYMAFVVGFEWIHIGNMLWVIAYALQSVFLITHLKRPAITAFLLIIAYFLAKNITDRFFGTFMDLRRPDFPEFLKNALFASILLIQFVVFAKSWYLAGKASNLSSGK